MSLPNISHFAPFPWSVDDEEPAIVRDATGAVVLTVDVDRERADDEVSSIANFVVSAVNNAVHGLTS